MARIHIKPDPVEAAIAAEAAKVGQVILDEGVGRPEPELEPIKVHHVTPTPPAVFWTRIMTLAVPDTYGGSKMIEQNQCSVCRAVICDTEFQ
jgi:hypothetical protein